MGALAPSCSAWVTSCDPGTEREPGRRWRAPPAGACCSRLGWRCWKGPRQSALPPSASSSAASSVAVTSALADLGRQAVVRSQGRGWLLSGDPPGELLELQELAVPLSPPS